ncbi:MAG: helix-turn-helix transcriptional regulator [Gemmatimonadetes bacterium]|nr:helix-turn-helix transcriptional regulator [Gemmatimonadota bacterium]
MTRTARSRRSGCPISIALELLGDPWSLLIVRDLMFKGIRTFSGFQQAGEGIATNILAERLKRLEAAGIITRRPDPDDGRRAIYALTPRGIDLAPMLVEMVIWSARHEETDAPPATVRAMKRDRDAFVREVRARLTGQAISASRGEDPSAT